MKRPVIIVQEYLLPQQKDTTAFTVTGITTFAPAVLNLFPSAAIAAFHLSAELNRNLPKAVKDMSELEINRTDRLGS